MSENTIMTIILSMKVDALEAVLHTEELKEYRMLLQQKKGNFIKVWGGHLAKDRLEEVLVNFDV
jgi:hypothetical protein